MQKCQSLHRGQASQYACGVSSARPGNSGITRQAIWSYHSQPGTRGEMMPPHRCFLPFPKAPKPDMMCSQLGEYFWRYVHNVALDASTYILHLELIYLKQVIILTAYRPSPFRTFTCAASLPPHERDGMSPVPLSVEYAEPGPMFEALRSHCSTHHALWHSVCGCAIFQIGQLRKTAIFKALQEGCGGKVPFG
ncbi:uncharacterized protein BO80DRAFT_93147 [Aspergillus ibericus CBS 121593]|uniref:Uncharacterized protein n=1 Tax=Aspergillus ibericus CBS 121593 TaxID=1448316 RepID=A0A395GZV5_9EURO|nr:hypothetical protein BO80DRAFT_93147 [Aspergillus ibericus CBS 121593]RAL00619.1 hypothetical protein BO80DRAFT_93147 [Aspergillus ibericus CBS 121593]